MCWRIKKESLFDQLNGVLEEIEKNIEVRKEKKKILENKISQPGIKERTKRKLESKIFRLEEELNDLKLGLEIAGIGIKKE